MKLTWHIVLKDLRHLRVPLATLVAVYLSEFAVGAWLLSGAVTTHAAFQAYQGVDVTDTFMRYVVALLLIPALVFDDVLVDTTAFWPTRPISGARLLGAKLLGCLLIFGALPLVVTLPWWLYCGYGAGEIHHAAVETLRNQVVPVALGLLVASLTGSFSRFIGWMVALLLGVGLSFVTMVKPVAIHLYFHGADQVADSGIDAARLHLFSWLAFCLGAGVVVHQFLTRRLARSLVFLACILGLLAVEVTWWPLDPKVSREVPGISSGLPGLDSRVAIVPKEGPRLHVEGDSADKSDGFVFGTFAVENATPEMLLRFEPPIFDWRWPDGRVLRQKGIILASAWQQPASGYQVDSIVPHKVPAESDWERSPGYQNEVRNGKPRTWEETFNSHPANRPWDYYVPVPRADGLRMLSDPSSFTLELQGEYLRPKLEAEVPLKTGSAWSGESRGFRIAKAEWNDRDKSYEAVVIEHRPAIGEAFNPVGFSNPGDSGAIYVAVNRSQGESDWGFFYGGYASTIHIATVAIVLRAVGFMGPENRRMADAHWDNYRWTGPSYQDWFSDATLARVTETVDGSFLRKMPIEKFTTTLDNYSKAP
jgi:hypothetical protein